MNTVKIIEKQQVVYYRDETNSGTDANNITHLILNLESFDYKANFMESGVTQ